MTKKVSAYSPKDNLILQYVLLGIFTILLISFLFIGVLDFLPITIRIPLVCACCIGWWIKKIRDRGVVISINPKLDAFVEMTGVILVLATYILLKIIGIHPSGTDDNIYFYMAFRFSQGAMPYKDFFFAHPPMHLIVPAIVFFITGFSITVAKSIPVVAQTVAGIFLYLSVRRTSKPLAFLVLIFHLLAYQVLMGSTDMNGENIMTAFLCIALFFAVKDKPFLSGIFSGCALASGLYCLPVVLALIIATFFSSYREAKHFLVGLLSSIGLTFGIFLVIGGSGFVDGVFTYHLAKPIKSENKIPVFSSLNPLHILNATFHNLILYLSQNDFKKAVYYHLPSYLGTGIAVIIIFGQALKDLIVGGKGGVWYQSLSPREMLRGDQEGLVKFSVLVVLLFIFQWANLAEVYDFYMVPMFAFMAIPTAYCVFFIYVKIRQATTPYSFIVPSILLLILSLHPIYARSLNADLWPEERMEAGKVVSYEWRKPWGFSSIADITRVLFFKDHRIKGEIEPPYRHYIWNKLLTFSKVSEIADYIQKNTKEDETITGASTLAPLIALYANRRISADEADTNTKRFKTGMLSEKAFFEKICKDNVRFIISASQSRFDESFMANNPTIKKYFTQDTTFADHQLKHFKIYPITLWKRLDVSGLPFGMVCDVQ